MTHDHRHRPYFVTTAIPYVNAAPHLGFALELVQADALARYQRGLGRPVRFLTGTDENSLKNARAAADEGVSTAALVERNARAFAALGPLLQLSVDDFIRTSADPRHPRAVAALWEACARAGDIYRGSYRGLYCVGCEQYLRTNDLIDGRCPEHLTAPEWIEEDNYYFRLGRYADRVAGAIAGGQLRILPESRQREVLRFIEGGVEDLSISRSRERALGWGIPVPGDDSQVIYVWFDALANYIAALDYGGDGHLYRAYWDQPGDRVHVIGKGITRFHALYWPAILLSAGLPLPTQLCVHGYLTVDGAKIGKSRGNAIEPGAVVARRGVDPLRYYLLRHVRSTGDGDFAAERLEQAYQSELANGLGNLLSRTVGLIERFAGGNVPEPGATAPEDAHLQARGDALPGQIHDAVERFQFSDALGAIWHLVDAANRYVVETAPWALSAGPRRDAALFHLADALHRIGIALAPFLPATSKSLLAQLGAQPGPRPAGWTVRRGPPLFPRA